MRMSHARLGLTAMLLPAATFSPASDALAQSANATLAEMTRIGPSAVEFGAVTDVAVDAAGRVWIADGLSGEVHVWEDGALRRVAVAGPGPGELRPGALELVVLAGDTVLVIEPHAARFIRFTADGGYVRTTRLGAVEGLTSGWRIDARGRLFARVNRQTFMQPGATPATAGDPVVVFDAEGEPVDTIGVLPVDASFRMGESGRPVITLLGSQPLWAVDATGRLLTARTDAYRIEVHENGAARVLVERDVAPARATADLIARARELLREELASRRMPPQAAEQLARSAAVAESAPVIGDVFAGPGGTIWIREAARSADELTDLEHPGGSVWQVYDSAGRALHRVETPAGFQPTGTRGDRVFGVLTDALGRTSAVVYRVDGAAG